MAQQSYAVYSQQQNRGTFSPGQKILVNNYTIQVERYLSQGGFAHVYVVRSATPINNTTQHVLKRIAVSDEAMLNEVRNEVDIMRLLRGHPNIVNIIDASCQTLPNGSYEVLILMEFCAGGGLIDMMNRRLRERLTEAEILQIFVDVCEAVAAMHNLKPALLHRDLKVENILQSSLTHYKLCDFGSSMPVAPRPPSSTQEIRVLEADLGRRTTLQYRAPEMVDVHLRRPIDEKSDVWALGVLLYKLCYYTTPFEEHGPLAILNVQYRFPAYPVYSTQLNSLIVSMLQELGTHRPSVFELLYKVHRMRGTKSPYPYNIPTQQPLRPPPQQPASSGLESLVSIRTSASVNASATAAAQARQTVLEAIAPMRRGRPAASSISSLSFTQQENGSEFLKFEEQFNAVKAANVKQKPNDAWDIRPGKEQGQPQGRAEDGQDGFGDSFVGSSATDLASSLPSTSQAMTKVSNANLNVPRDAFEGLGGISRSREPSPTLAEAASNTKLRTNGSARPPPLNGISRTPIPAQTSVPLSPWIPASRTGLATYHSPVLLPAEERFPSLDDLDKGWRLPVLSQVLPARTLSQPDPDPTSATLTPPQTGMDSLAQTDVRPRKLSNNGALREAARAQPAIGADDRSGKGATSPNLISLATADRTSVVQPTDKRQLPIGSSPTKYRPSRPALARKRRNSASVNATAPPLSPKDWLTGDDSVVVTSPVDRQLSPSKRRLSATSPGPSSSLASFDVSGVSNNLRQKPSAPTQQAIKSSEQFVPYSIAADSREVVDSKRPHVHTRPHASEVSRRQDSSSDDPEGPEDVNPRAMDKDRKRRAKGRQSSVHDLVDLYGGAARVPADPDRTRSPSPLIGRKGRRTSGLLVDLTLSPAASSAPNLLSPATIIPASRADLASRSSGSGSYGEQVSPPASPTEPREQTSRQNSSPGPSVTDRSDRPRPQSMFVLQPKPAGDAGNLRAPEGPRHRLSSRRGSISDMVDLYENLGGKTKAKDPPAIATKPTALRALKTTSPIVSRLPVISPTGTSFSQVIRVQPKVNPKPRPSTAKTSSDDSNISSIASQISKPKDQFTPRLPPRQSISPGKPTPRALAPSPIIEAASKPAKPALLSIPKLANPITSGSVSRTPVTESPISSPSPERPFPGVGRLIDQWQKKAEEADGSRRSGPPPPGRPLGPRVAFGKRETSQMGKGD